MKRTPLHVSLHAREPSVVELTLGERVQLDRVVCSPRGSVAERHGRLLAPGVTRVGLPPGHYIFKTLSDAHLRVVTGGVSAGIVSRGSKDVPPPPAGDDTSLPVPSARGDEAPGAPPHFTLDHA